MEIVKSKLYSAAMITAVSKHREHKGNEFYVICAKDMSGWYNNFLLSPQKIDAIKCDLGVIRLKDAIGELLLLDVTDSYGTGLLPTFFKTRPQRGNGYYTNNSNYNLVDSERIWEYGDDGT